MRGAVFLGFCFAVLSFYMATFIRLCVCVLFAIKLGEIFHAPFAKEHFI